MRIDLWVPTANPFATPEVLAADRCRGRPARGGDPLGRRARGALRRVRVGLPLCGERADPGAAEPGLLEPLSTLSFLAATTERVRLGTAMVLLPQRNPVYTAKEVATLDWLSNGRVDFGVGVGWLDEEFDAVNVPWPHRGRRCDEYLDVLSHPLVRRDLLVLGRLLHSAGLLDVPEAGAGAASSRPHRR